MVVSGRLSDPCKHDDRLAGMLSAGRGARESVDPINGSDIWQGAAVSTMAFMKDHCCSLVVTVTIVSS